MSQARSREIVDLNENELRVLIGTFLNYTIIHYGMWFTNASLKLGKEKAHEFEHRVAQRYFQIALARLAPHFNIELKDGIPGILFEKSREDLILLLGDIAKTWLAGDGLWFQAIEGSEGMEEAKLVNDSCWSLFARLEAFKIKNFLGAENEGVLTILERALNFRIYSSFNAHSAEWDSEGNLIFYMTECRVQSARRRKRMDDYPCKSAGINEYTEFASGIDPNIVTECLWCPPDRVPDKQFCAWKFSLKK